MKTTKPYEPDVMQSSEPERTTVFTTFRSNENLRFSINADGNLVVTAYMMDLPPMNFPFFSEEMSQYMRDNKLPDMVMDLMYRAVEHAMRQGALLTLFMGQLEK